MVHPENRKEFSVIRPEFGAKRENKLEEQREKENLKLFSECTDRQKA